MLAARIERLESRDNPVATFVDFSFGTDGVAVLADFGTIADLATLNDGSTVVLGTGFTSNAGADFWIARMTPSGQPDPAFGTDGQVAVPFDLVGPDMGNDQPVDLSVLPDGGLVVLGTALDASGTVQVAVARLDSAGKLDATFDGDGKLTFSVTPDPTFGNAVEALALLADGSIAISGRTSKSGSAGTGYAVRLTPTGAFETNYGVGGTANLGSDARATTVDGSGNAYVLRNEADITIVFVNRFDADGQFDASYGGGGRADLGPFQPAGGQRDSSVTLLPLADGGLLASYNRQIGSVRQRLSDSYRLLSDGKLDTTFGTGGKTTELDAPGVKEGLDGRLVAFQPGGLSNPSPFLVGLAADGTLDPTFGTDGRLAVSELAFPSKIAAPPLAETVVVAGSREIPAMIFRNVVMRYVTKANELPTIAVPNPTVTFTVGTSATVPFTLGDVETPADALQASAVSSLPSLFPPGTLTVSGTGANRTLTLRSTPPNTGFAIVTIRVFDANGGLAQATVTVEVRPAPVALVGESEFAAGPDAGGGPVVATFNPDGSARRTFAVLQAGFTGGVRVASADFTRDGVAEIVVGTGPGSATRVEIYDGISFARLFAIDPFEPSFTGGVFVSAGDLNGDGVADLVVSPDEGGGPRVRVYDGASFNPLADFFGIDDVSFRGGARTAVGDIDGDGTSDLVVAAGFGGGPRVAAFDGTTLSKTPEKIFGDFFAFEQTLRNGIFVTAGDLNGDGFADLIAGGGPGGGPRVLVFDGKSLLSNQYVNLANFFGGDPDSRGGIRLAVKDLDGDNRADLVVGSGSGAGSRVTAYLGKNIAPAGTPPAALDFDSFAGFTGGVFVG